MKSRGLLSAVTLLVAACTAVIPTPLVTQEKPSPIPTSAPSPTPALSVECGPITDPAACASAVKTAVRLARRWSTSVASIIIEPRSPGPSCPSGTTCLVPTAVELFDAAGEHLEKILLAEYPGGVWDGYPVAYAAVSRDIYRR